MLMTPSNLPSAASLTASARAPRPMISIAWPRSCFSRSSASEPPPASAVRAAELSGVNTGSPGPGVQHERLEPAGANQVADVGVLTPLVSSVPINKTVFDIAFSFTRFGCGPANTARAKCFDRRPSTPRALRSGRRGGDCGRPLQIGCRWGRTRDCESHCRAARHADDVSDLCPSGSRDGSGGGRRRDPMSVTKPCGPGRRMDPRRIRPWSRVATGPMIARFSPPGHVGRVPAAGRPVRWTAACPCCDFSSARPPPFLWFGRSPRPVPIRGPLTGRTARAAPRWMPTRRRRPACPAA